MSDLLLEVENLRVNIRAQHGKVLEAVRDLNFSISQGERIGLVGESGSGKSLSALSIMRLLHAPYEIHGSVKLNGVNLLSLSDSKMAKVRAKELGMVYQDPTSSLNPVFTIGDQIIEAIQLSEKVSKLEARDRAIGLLEEVGVVDAKNRIDDYPHQFSGGMRQRVMIAMAISTNPKLLLADEPTTALDVTTQAKVIELLNRVVAERKISVILITHDLGVASSFCDRLFVMYGGKIVESGAIDEVISSPAHPYTRALVSSICTMDMDVTKPIKAIGGHPPTLASLPAGCTFNPRCPAAVEERCRIEVPLLRKVGTGRHAACHLVGEVK